VLPAHRSAQERGLVELSTTAFYHPILPLLCDTDIGRVSTPGLPLPQRFQHPEDAREQIQRSVAKHESVFGAKPKGAWPSEGSVSEEVLAYELGYRVQPHRRISISLAGFYNDYDNLRSVEQVNPPAAFPVVLGNGQKGESYGAELTADYRVTDWLQLHGGYTALKVQIHPKADSTDRSFGSGESHDPNHQFFLRSSLELPWHFEFDASFRYVTGIANQDVPAYPELDLRLAWKPIESLELSIVGQNLLHDHHPEFGALSSRQEIERSVYGKVTWRF